MKKIFKTTFTLTVLSEEPIESPVSLDDVLYECNEGSFLSKSFEQSEPVILEGKVAADAVYEAGSEPSFFNIDDEGNDTDTD